MNLFRFFPPATRVPASLLALGLLLSGCGYQVGEIRPTAMKGIRTIAVQNFGNNSYEPRLETLAADTLIKQFQQDGTYTVVSDIRADAILYGEIAKVQRRSLRSLLDNVLATDEFQLEVTVFYDLTDRVTGRSIKSGTIIGRTSFFTSPDLQQDERQAMPLAIQDAANQIVSTVTEGF